MVGLWIIGAVAVLAWMAGLEGLVILGLLFLLIIIGTILTTIGGVSKRRNHKQKYHPIH